MVDKKSDTEGLAERILKLAELVEYHEGSIVSRTIIDQETGTLTLFAFSQGQGLSEHTAPFDALVHLLDGQAEVAISGKSYPLKAGETIIMPANKPHALKATKDFKMLLVMIRS
jgi:quercetin dioxygenase-like cupin family protein